MTQYEITFLIEPGLKKTARDKILKELEKTVKTAGGSVIEKDEWGKKMLSYEIADHTDAYYYHYLLEGGSSLPEQVRQQLLAREDVLRELVVRRNVRGS